MFGLADRWVGRQSRPLDRLLLVRLVTLVMCGVAAFLLIAVASASAVSKAEETEAAEHSEYFFTSTKPIEDETEECSGSSCTKGHTSVPPGQYLASSIAQLERIRVLEYGEHHCQEVEKHEVCAPYYNERPEKSTEYLPSGYKELYRTIDSGSRPELGVRESYLVYIYDWKPAEKDSESLGATNPSEPNNKPCLLGYPVNCATGNQVESQTDLATGGRGPALELTRTYNSHLAAQQTEPGPFGYGWTSSYSAHLELNAENLEATVYQDNGSTATFSRADEGEAWTAPSSLVEATLVDEGSEYVYTLPNQTKLHFNSEGKLTSQVDRDGNILTMSYESGHLVSVTDAAGRKLILAYNSEGRVESAKDPMGHTVKYTYESGNLKSVTQPAESTMRWQFKYNSEHELTSETDGRDHTVTTEYNGSQQVVSQTDALSRKREWHYAGSASERETTITEPNGSETVERLMPLESL